MTSVESLMELPARALPSASEVDRERANSSGIQRSPCRMGRVNTLMLFFFFKQKTAYEMILI